MLHMLSSRCTHLLVTERILPCIRSNVLRNTERGIKKGRFDSLCISLRVYEDDQVRAVLLNLDPFQGLQEAKGGSDARVQ
jgi:hypothetical protein